jgi:hypothetical protein
LLKNAGRTLKQKLYKVSLKIRNKEQLPTYWNEGIVCPLYRKGDRLKYNNYSPIKLLNIALKIFAVLLTLILLTWRIW